MNPVFYALCIIAGIFIWACFGDAIKEMSDEDENNKNKGENKHE